MCAIRFFVPFLLAGLAAFAQPYDLNRVVAGKPAPDFELPQAQGKPVKLSDFRGRNVVLVFYRGYW